MTVVLFLLIATLAWAQDTALPVFIGQTITMIPSAVDSAGRLQVFGSSITPDGTPSGTMDIYVVATDGTGLRRLTKLAGGLQTPRGATAVSLTGDGLWAAFSTFATGAPAQGEEIHLLDVAHAADKVLTVDTGGCIQPLTPVCISCFFTCVRTPHIAPSGTPGGTLVLYAVSRQNPFYVVKSDGSKTQNPPIFTGTLAASPQRVISGTGAVVFTSSSPFGPTFAATAWDVYLMNLDGAGIRQVTKFGDSSVFASEAAISADGSAIVFLANFDAATGKATNKQQIFSVRADGSGLRQITTGAAVVSSPSFSGDGARLTFISDGQVWVAAGDGTGAKRLTNFQQSTARNSAISDDGTRIAFALGPASGGIGSMWVVSSDGSGLRVLYAPRSLNPRGLTGAAQSFGNPVAGSLASAFGTNFTGDGITYAASLPLPDSLAGVSLTLNGAPLPMLSVGPWQINAQIPPEQNEGPAAFEVRFQDGTRSAPMAQAIQALGPAIFLLPDLRPNQAAVLHGNTGTPVDPVHPAAAGEALEIYASGLGPTNPFVRAGVAAPSKPPAATLASPEVMIGGKATRVLFSGLAPGFVGVYQVNVIVPEGLRPGDNSVTIKIGNLQGFGGVISTK